MSQQLSQSTSAVPLMAGSMVTFHLLATVCMALRLYSKRLSMTRYFLDDYVLIAGWVSLDLHTTKYGLGFPTNDVFALPEGQELLSQLELWQVSVLFMAHTATWLAKLSFFITLLRLVTRQSHKTMLWLAMTTSTAFMIALSVIQPFTECGSYIVKLLNEDPNDNCISRAIVARICMVGLAYSALMDFLLSMAPTVVMWKLRIERRQKIAVICAMSTGCFAGIIAILLAVWTYRTFLAGQLDLYAFGVGSAIKSAEISCTITAATIPFIRPLITKRRPAVEIVDMGVLNGGTTGSRQSKKHTRLGSSGGDSGANGSHRNQKQRKNEDTLSILEVEKELQGERQERREAGGVGI
ncbi:hypothetical protein B0T20DRAFT_470560 [Sordaria brevicollis]|uniref:Rhodopsin domain-containing protein n=1 Tax=Sordaria brevicollis TaxID=83679 RepID=A0AAE0PBP6_SORBR|nr:hypothetical protein B0T20DRAFT_470560 [Sordaria brevicollis]